MAPRRQFDPALEMPAVTLALGDILLSHRQEEALTAVLGADIAICLSDLKAGTGGMARFTLPPLKTPPGHGPLSHDVAQAYGRQVIASLLDGMMALGARRERMTVRIYGGADLGEAGQASGADNAAFALGHAKALGLLVAATQTGGAHLRRIHFFPATGRARLRELPPHAEAAARPRLAHAHFRLSPGADGSVEIYD